MTLEELQAKLDQLESDSEAKAARIAELGKENAKWRRMAQGKDGMVDPDEYQKVADELDSLKANYAKLEKAYKTDSERLTKTLSEREGKLHEILVEGGITEALVKANVAPELMKAAKALLKGGAAVKDGAAFMGDKPLADAVTEWAASDEGKHFIRAPANTGGGSNGNGNGTGGKKFAEMTSEERVALFRSNPQQYEALKSAS